MPTDDPLFIKDPEKVPELTFSAKNSTNYVTNEQLQLNIGDQSASRHFISINDDKAVSSPLKFDSSTVCIFTYLEAKGDSQFAKDDVLLCLKQQKIKQDLFIQITPEKLEQEVEYSSFENLIKL